MKRGYIERTGNGWRWSLMHDHVRVRGTVCLTRDEAEQGLREYIAANVPAGPMVHARRRRAFHSVADMAIGERHGRWTIISLLSGSRIEVRCDCGTIADRAAHSIACGESRSCGCLAREKNIARSTKHGDAPEGKPVPEYRAWCGMKNRCYQRGSRGYRWYGAKGVTVCDRWRESYAAFLADMGRKPSSQYTLDRIDPFGNYEPGNCRWATWKTQANNKRRNARAA